MSDEEKKGPRKKSEEEKQEEKDAMINLWMNNLGDAGEPKKAEENLETEQK